MRTDENLSRNSFRFSSQWKRNAIGGSESPEIDRRLAGGQIVDGKFIAHSLSGHERNHLFFNQGGADFQDISLISGLDTPADSRGFVLWDYDRDGWQDVAVVNANDPLLNLYHNEIGRLDRGNQYSGGRMIAIRLVGGNRTNQPSSFACRDGYGAMVTVSLGEVSLKREQRCGEGYATQNSDTMIVGMGSQTVARAVSVRWPSGKSHSIPDVPGGTLLTAYENIDDSPSRSSFVSEPYHMPSPDRRSVLATRRATSTLRLAGDAAIRPSDRASPRLHLYTTMATWCPSCKAHLPMLRYLNTTLGENALDLVGIPIDETDTSEKLNEYVARFQPPYRLLAGLTSEDRSQVSNILTGQINAEALPSTIVTDDDGNVILVRAGIPSVSQLRKLLQVAP